MKTVQPFLIIFVSFLIFYFFVLPQWNIVSSLRVQNVEIIGALGKANELAQIRDQLLAQYNTISPQDIAKLSRVAPEKYEPMRLIADVNSLASEYGMFIRNVKIVDQKVDTSQGVIQAPTEVEAYSKKEFSFTTRGQYRNFISFIDQLEKSLQLLDIQKIEISDKQKEVGSLGSGDLDFKVTLVTYWIN